MAKHPSDDLTFEHWIEWMFDRPVTYPQWYQDEHVELWIASPVVIVDYIRRLFEAAPIHLQGFSDAQASQGLYFLVSGFFFDGLSALYGEGILQSQRQRCINSIYTLFKDYFAVRCSNHRSGGDEANENPLDGTCFMWWDLLHDFAQGPEGRIGSDMDSEILATLEKISQLNHDVCTKSALHGLGHWRVFCPDRVTAIIDTFLASNPNLDQDLRTYALQARDRYV